MPGKFEVYKDKSGQFRFRLKASNGQVIGTSESYKTRSGAMNGITSVQKNAPDKGSYEFKESKGKTYFNLKAKNRQVILSSQGYSTEANAQKGAQSIMKHAADAMIVEV